jgi:uncharacterized protein YaiI (UPF0178 family)
MPTLYVDADACPVRPEAERVALRKGWPLVLVCNGGIRPPADPRVRLVVVDQGPDAADRWIAGAVVPGDAVVTADLPLAARCIEGGAVVVQPDGEVLTAANIGPRLALRDLMADLRAADPFREGGGRPFGRAERARFLQALDRVLG